MARKKKSRKVGQIGVPSVSKELRKRKPAAPSKPKMNKGNKPGSRHSAGTSETQAIAKENKDPRLGSKKPVPLIVETKASKPKSEKPRYFSPAQELEALENNDKLNGLLDQIDDGVVLSVVDQKYVDECLARHRVLCELLGINDQDEEEQAENSLEDDPLARLNAIDINKFK